MFKYLISLYKGALFLRSKGLSGLVSDKNPTVGAVLSNGRSDLTKATEMDATYYRVGPEKAIDFANNATGDFIVLLGQKSDGAQVIADQIKFLSTRMNRQPTYWAVVNEDDTYTFEDLYEVRKLLPDYANIIKGAHHAVVEGAGRAVYDDYFNGNRTLDDRKDVPHLLHFYLKPVTVNVYYIIQNAIRLARLSYTIKELNDRGYNNIIIDEAHDGSTTADNLPEAGDLVYATGQGFAFIVAICKLLCINIVMYYCAPFLEQEGNTVTEWKKHFTSL